MNLDPAELKQLATIWGCNFADALVGHPAWPNSDKDAAIRAANYIVLGSIIEIAQMWSDSDFAEHLPMVRNEVWASYCESLPMRRLNLAQPAPKSTAVSRSKAKRGPKT